MTDDDMPTMQCPRCGAEHPDHDGFGFIAHTKPAYSDGCGFCSHPSRDGDGKGGMVCGICGDVVCGECHGATVEFRGRGKDSEYKICSRYREPGHKTVAETDALIRANRAANYPRSGRFA